MKILYKPLKVWGKVKLLRWFYLLLIIIAGQAGIILSIIYMTKLVGLALGKSILIHFQISSFYTFSLALVASSIYSVFVSMVFEEESDYKSLMLGAVSFAILLIIIMAGFSLTSMEIFDKEFIDGDKLKFDYTQTLFWVIAIFTSLYLYALKYLPIIDDVYLDSLTDENLKIIKEKSETIENDGRDVQV